MRKLKSFYDSEAEFTEIHHSLKQTACPHCKRVGCLILHGFLKGYGTDCNDRKIIRGHRIFCSNRYRSSGCGRTFCLLASRFIRGFVITATVLWRFLEKLAAGFSKKTSFTESGASCCGSGAYRLFRRVILGQSHIRSILLRHRPAPEPPTSIQPLFATVSHLRNIFPDSPCPVSSFQSNFQVSFL